MTKKRKPITPVVIEKYRVDKWLNLKTEQAMYGVSCKIKGGKGWMRAAEDFRIVLYDTKGEALAWIAAMKIKIKDRHVQHLPDGLPR